MGPIRSTDFAHYGRMREAWLRTFLQLPHGIPTHDTFTRVLSRLDRHAFAACLTQWAQVLAAQVTGEVVAIDGKTARRSGEMTPGRTAPPLHMVSAWATSQQLVLGEVKTDAKSNEITAIPQLLALLALRGQTVTIDALGCQTGIAAAIRAKRAHYVLSVKENQPTLHRQVAAVFAHGPEDTVYWRHTPCDRLTTVEKGHGGGWSSGRTRSCRPRPCWRMSLTGRIWGVSGV